MLLTYDPAARRLGIALFATFVISIGFAGVVSATEGCNAIGYDIASLTYGDAIHIT